MKTWMCFFGIFLKNLFSECSSLSMTLSPSHLHRKTIVMSCLLGKTFEYTFTNLYVVTSRPVSSLTSRNNVYSSDSPFLILPPGNHHCPLAGQSFLLKNNSESFLTMMASMDGIGIHFNI